MKQALIELRAASFARLRADAFDTQARHGFNFANACLDALAAGSRSVSPSHLQARLKPQTLRELAAMLPHGLREIAAAAAPLALTFAPVVTPSAALHGCEYENLWRIGVGSRQHTLSSRLRGFPLAWLAFSSPGQPVDAVAIVGRWAPPAGLDRKQRDEWERTRLTPWRHSAAVNAKRCLNRATELVAEIAPPIAQAMQFEVSRTAMVTYMGQEPILTA